MEKQGKQLKISVLGLFTCFNRKELTKSCIESAVSCNPELSLSFVVVDDCSKDGTQEMLEGMQAQYDLTFLEGNGSLFYSGGMRMGMEYIKHKIDRTFDYVLLMNDDVTYHTDAITKMVLRSVKEDDAVIVGPTEDGNGNMTYGAIKYTKGIDYITIPVSQPEREADTFNANCVLVPWRAFMDVDSMDGAYKHSLGDFDYGLTLHEKGYKIYSLDQFVGICKENSPKGVWTDASLPIKERLRLKESVKGAPFKPWFHYLHKHFGVWNALVRSCTPYLRIFLKK